MKNVRSGVFSGFFRLLDMTVREIMDYNADLIAFLQDVAGRSVSRDTSEQSMVGEVKK
jgi:hypothetical protein